MRTLPGASRVCGGDGARTSRSRHHRNAARVLPLPVGAWMSVCRPVEIDAQPPTCAGVGASKADSNQARTAGENGASESIGGAAAARGVSLCAVADVRRLGCAGGRGHGAGILLPPPDFDRMFETSGRGRQHLQDLADDLLGDADGPRVGGLVGRAVRQAGIRRVVE